jgi:hypothetical protein
MLDGLDKEVKAVKSEIKGIIKSNENMNENYGLAKSIKGVGPVITTDS